MKFLKIAGAAFVAVFAMSMAMATSAFAVDPLWLVCLEKSEAGTKYEDSGCQKINESTGKFRSIPIPVGSTVGIRLQAFSLRLTDTKALGGESTVECNSDKTKDTAEGVAEGGNVTGKLTSAEINATEVNKRCRRISGGCEAGKIEKVKGVNLPWNLKGVDTAGTITTVIENSGAGEPGWAVTCHSILGSRTDTCTSVNKEYEETTDTNVVTPPLLIRSVFKETRLGTCSEGGAKAARVSGLIANLLVTGNALSLRS